MSQSKPPAGPVHQQFVLDMANRQAQTHQNLGRPAPPAANPAKNTVKVPPQVTT
jgi:hypothetical protein